MKSEVVAATSSFPTPPREVAWADDLGCLHHGCGCLTVDLTEREAEVLEQLALGRSTGAAAHRLYVSHQAVTYHVGNLLAKFQCDNRTGLVSRAFVLGVLDRTWPPRVTAPVPGASPMSKGCRHQMKGRRRTRTQG